MFHLDQGRIFERITKVHDELIASTEIDEESYCIILTGQPGIGKTMFLEYAMCRTKAVRLLQGIRYLFVNEGAFKEPADFLSSQY